VTSRAAATFQWQVVFLIRNALTWVLTAWVWAVDRLSTADYIYIYIRGLAGDRREHCLRQAWRKAFKSGTPELLPHSPPCPPPPPLLPFSPSPPLLSATPPSPPFPFPCPPIPSPSVPSLSLPGPLPPRVGVRGTSPGKFFNCKRSYVHFSSFF
jgi:hypothetical protein